MQQLNRICFLHRFCTCCISNSGTGWRLATQKAQSGRLKKPLLTWASTWTYHWKVGCPHNLWVNQTLVATSCLNWYWLSTSWPNSRSMCIVVYSICTVYKILVRSWSLGITHATDPRAPAVGGADVVPGDEDGGLPPSAQETMKLLKRLGYPEVQDTTKPSALLTKVSTALTKRMGKLEEVKKLFAAGGDSALVRKNLGT